MKRTILSNNADTFINAMIAQGLTPPSHIEPGRMYRFAGQDKSASNTAAWCRLFEDCEGGVYGDWSTGLDEVWQARSEAPITAEERHTRRKAREQARHKAEAQQASSWAEAATHARSIWTSLESDSAPRDHPYLIAKKIGPGISRICDDALVLPITNGEGEVVSLQFIRPDGTKRMLKGGQKRGCLISVMSTLGKSRIIITEGWATAMTIAMTEDATVLAAIDADNLLPVAMLIRSLHPNAEIIIAGDDDRQTKGNPGRAKANEAALSIGGLVAFPEWPDNCPDSLTDFNDQHCWNIENGGDAC